MKAITWILAILLVGAIVWLVLMNGNNKGLDQEAELLQQKIDGQKITIKENSEAYLKKQKETDAKIAELNGMIDSSNTVIVNRDDKIATKDKKIKELREAQKSITNKDELIKNLTKQIFALDSSLVLARKDISDLGRPVLEGRDEEGKPIYSYPEGSVTFALNEKYETENKLRLQADDLLELLSRQSADKTLMIENIKKQLAHQKRVSLYEKLGVSVACLLLGVIAE